MISGAMNAGFQGIQKGLQGMQNSAERLTSSTGVPAAESGQALQSSRLGGADSLDEITSAVIDLKLYEQVTAASVSVFRTADETIGTLLDTLA